MKLCQDCRFFRPIGNFHFCIVERSPVDGSPIPTFCVAQRSMGQICGPEGRKFEPTGKAVAFPSPAAEETTDEPPVEEQPKPETWREKHGLYER